jgi:signal peptidase
MIKLYKKITNNTIFKITERLFSVLLTFVLVVLLVIILVQKTTNNRFNLGGYGIYTVATGSMEPEYLVKDLILSSKVDPKEINVGDDIVYLGKMGSLNDKIITHRVIKVEEKDGRMHFVTKGIANSLEDPEIDESQVLGIVEHKLQVLSFVSRTINSIYGFIFLIVIPFIIFVFYEVKCIIDEYYKNKEG